MEKVKLFQYAAIYYPTKEEEKKGDKPKVVIEPATILAKDEGVAVLKVARSIPSEYEDKMDQIDIAIRPF